MATTETAATDSKTIMKGTTEQNKTDSYDERIKTRPAEDYSNVLLYKE